MIFFISSITRGDKRGSTSKTRKTVSYDIQTTRGEYIKHEKECFIRYPNNERCRAANNGRSTDNVRPARGLDQSNSGLAGHFDWSFLDTNTLFSIQLSLNSL